jgi:membrane protease YdiL (CAAX protease family)
MTTGSGHVKASRDAYRRWRASYHRLGRVRDWLACRARAILRLLAIGGGACHETLADQLIGGRMTVAVHPPRSGLAGLIRGHPGGAYCAMTFAISWAAALCVAWPWLRRGQAPPTLAGLLMFPAMLLGPAISGILLTRLLGGPGALRGLGARLRVWRMGWWYAVLLIPPLLVYAVLELLRHWVASAFAPNMFLLGVLFGIPAGYLEEIGWTGFAFDALRRRRTALGAAVLLGSIWSAWHLPVVDFLGAAHPHGVYWLPFFLAFALAMTAIRVLICWVYVNTGSVLAAQLLHMASTGALVVFGAARADPPQEAFWYALYGLALWGVVAAVVGTQGSGLQRHRLPQ